MFLPWDDYIITLVAARIKSQICPIMAVKSVGYAPTIPATAGSLVHMEIMRKMLLKNEYCA